MNKRAREIALRIQLLFEEFTSSELIDGLSLLGAAKDEDLLAFLLRKTSAGSTNSRISKPPRVQGGTTLNLLEHRDPEKYRLLQDFKSQFQNGSLLPTMDSCRMFGNELSKAFEPGKSRKECLPRLLSILAEMSPTGIRDSVAKAASYLDREGSEPYRRLASHIISGSSSR